MRLALNPGDILVNLNHRKDPISTIKRWAGGPCEHVFMYLGKVRLIVDPKQNMTLRFPLLFESNGRGVVIQALSNRYRQEVVVLRLKSEFDRRRIPRVLREAVKLASAPNSYYDFFAIARFVLPRLICEKLGLPLPLKYQRNPAMLCSEACAEIFWRAGLTDIVSRDIVPLPSSFVESSLLIRVWEGELSLDSA